MTPIKQLRENGIDLRKVQDGHGTVIQGEYEVYVNEVYIGYLARERHNGTGPHGHKTPGFWLWTYVQDDDLYLDFDSFDEAKAGLLNCFTKKLIM